jgi:ATP-dependent DNA ligase
MKPQRIYQGKYLDKLLEDPEWDIEMKVDGTRGNIYVLADRRIELWDRHRNIIPEEIVPDLYAALRRLPLPPGTILDGEVYPRGVAATKHPAPGKFKLALFDIMALNEPLKTRQATLRGVLGGRTTGIVHYVEQAHDDKRAFFDQVWQDERAEGVVLKKLDSPRIDDPKTTKVSPYWIKVVKPSRARA